MKQASVLRVFIFEDREAGKPCAEDCGVDWLKAENQQLAQRLVKQRFGEQVQLHFVNLHHPGERERYPQVLRRVAEENMFLPLLEINGEVKINGYFDMRMLTDMIEVAREVADVRKL